jgi:talin
LSHGKWLDSNKILGYFDFRQNDMVEYRKKHRLMGVKVIDGALKTLLLDESLSVSKLTEEICNHVGLCNANEYSLAVEVEEKTETGVLFKRSRDTLNEKWLKPYATLSGQGITANLPFVILRKKFFFSDQSIDQEDLVQLNIVYQQSRLSVLRNDYLITTYEAINFAALQCQIQLGNYQPNIHIPTLLNLEEFVARDFIKKRDLEKKIFNEYSKLTDLSPIDAQYRYVQLCRSLKLYGVTFFLISESDSKKNKTKRLLGISRDGITIVDHETRQVINKWSLYNIRRWTSTPHTFTLDFGDYADKNYIVYTIEGDLIAQFISGYVDIVVQKRKLAEKVMEDQCEDQDFAEEEVIPVKASTISAAPGSQGSYTVQSVGLTGNVLDNTAMKDRLYGTRYLIPTIAEIIKARKVLDSTTERAISIIASSQYELEAIKSLPINNNDELLHWITFTIETYKQKGSLQLARILVATCDIISTICDDEIDYTTATSSVSIIATDIALLLDYCCMIASLQNDKAEHHSFIEASNNMATTSIEFLRSLNNYTYGKVFKEDVLIFSRTLGLHCAQLLFEMGDITLNRVSQQELIGASQNVSLAVSRLVDITKDVAGKSIMSANPLNSVSFFLLKT